LKAFIHRKKKIIFKKSSSIEYKSFQIYYRYVSKNSIFMGLKTNLGMPNTLR
jgi:catabolite regulation protein CreA